MDELPTIEEFYTDRSIFITGGTGFLGKVLIEKLLRCCYGLKKIYVLVRPKRGKCVGDRMDTLLESTVFNRVREEQPNFHEKVSPIKGDVTADKLGISEHDASILKQNVSIVFHSAATVRFDEPLRVAVELNVIAVRKVIQLCRSLPHLEALVHVSTAYSNCDIMYIEEKFYPPPVEPQKIIEALEWMDDEMVDSITPKLLGNKPNTYTFTKHLAEALLEEEAQGLPFAIVRPSIIGAAWREPYPGWIDNLNGPSGFYIAIGKGILRSLLIERESVADIVPVDLPVNLLVSTAWNLVVKKPELPPIYNCTVGTVNPFTWGEMRGIIIEFFKYNPLDAAFRRPHLVFTKDRITYDYWNFVNHIIPAHLVDFAYRLIGKRPRMVRIYQKVEKMVSTMRFFTLHTWEWTHLNTEYLMTAMNAKDKKTFSLDARALNWPEYIEVYCLGTKKYVLNEEMSGLPAARAHLRKLRNIRYGFNTIMVVILWRVLIARSQFARNLWYFVMNLAFKFVRFCRISGTVRRN